MGWHWTFNPERLVLNEGSIPSGCTIMDYKRIERIFKQTFSQKIGTTLRSIWQSITRGWTDADLIDLDVLIARELLPQFRRFQELNDCVPGGLTEEEWKAILEQICKAFEFICQGKEKIVEHKKEIDKGLELFVKHYFDLWW